MTYEIYFGDIRDPSPDVGLGGLLDSMSLLHLGEPPEPTEGMLTEREVIECALTWSREVVFYDRSAAWDRIAPLVYALVDEGKMEHTATYKSLVAFRPTHG